MNGMPLTNRNTVIVTRARIENTAEKRNTPRITFSLALINPYKLFILLGEVAPLDNRLIAGVHIIDVFKVIE